MRGVLEAAYVLAVTVVAVGGFVSGSTAAILAAAVLSLPVSLVAVPLYYAVYGLLALFPGANPTSSSGSAGCSPGGGCHETTTGDLAPWFAVMTDVVGVLAFTSAALLNVVLLRLFIRRGQPVDHDFAGRLPGW